MGEIEVSENQTKQWRKDQYWYFGGKKNECEIFQREKLEYIMGLSIPKSNMRFNIENNTFEDILHPYKLENGYEYTEDMDGYCMFGETDFYFNLKMVCMSGGAQTRSLKEVYHFIEAQCAWLLDNKTKKVVFINILDGDFAYKNRDKFKYLLEKKDQAKYKGLDNIYIGDLKYFQLWFLVNKHKYQMPS